MSNVVWKKITLVNEKKCRGDATSRWTDVVSFKYKQIIYPVCQAMQMNFWFFLSVVVFLFVMGQSSVVPLQGTTFGVRLPRLKPGVKHG